MSGGAITSEEVLFFLAVLGTVAGMWWRVEGAIKAAKAESMTRAEAAGALATLAQVQLAEHKLHVAENYITKSGLREQTEQIMGGMATIKSSVDQLNQRMDRVIENRHVPPVKPLSSRS